MIKKRVQHYWIPVIILIVILSYLSGSTTFASSTTRSDMVCEPSLYYGIQHCSSSDGLAQAVVIDLYDPHIRFQTVLPMGPNGECNSVNSGSNCTPYQFEKVAEMLARYLDSGAVAIINADYFGPNDHGAQGLAVRNGERLDGRDHGDDDDLAYTQPSMAISPSNLAIIGTPESPEAITAHLSTIYYNTVGGAPIIVSKGQVVNPGCTYPYPGDTCGSAGQSAVGLTNDGRLVMMTAQEDAVRVANRLIEDYQVHTAMKLDGGGSARLAWLDVNSAIQSFGGTDEDRSVAQGLLVFSERIEAEQPVKATSKPFPSKTDIDGFGMGSSTHLRVKPDELVPALDKLQEMGVRWVREEIPWGEVELPKDTFRWKYSFGDKKRDYDRLLTELEQRGIWMLALLDYGPSYLPGPIPDGQLETLWKNYVYNVVDEFGDRIDYWEIGNETNSPQFWGKVIYPQEEYHPTRLNPDLYASMLRSAYDIIKQHDRNDVVVLGGLVGLVADDCISNPFEYLQKINAAGAWDAFDAIAIHPYWGPNPPEAIVNRGRAHDTSTGVCRWDKTAAYNLLGEVRALRDLAANYGSKPIWITETGWSEEWLETLAQWRGISSDQVEADYVVRTYVPLLAEPGIEKVFWYTQVDDSIGTNQLDFEGQCALGITSAFLTGSKALGQFQGQDDQGREGDDDVYEYRFEKDGQLIIAIWKARGGEEYREVTIKDLEVRTIFAYDIDATDLSLEAGREYPVKGKSITLQLNEHPIFLVGDQLNKFESFFFGLVDGFSSMVTGFWETATEKLTNAWDDLKEKANRWIEELQAEIERKIVKAINEWLDDLFGQICITTYIPGGVALAWLAWKRPKINRDE